MNKEPPIQELNIPMSPKLRDDLMKYHNVHNVRSLDFTRMEGAMERRRYDLTDKVMTLVMKTLLENNRTLTLPAP